MNKIKFTLLFASPFVFSCGSHDGSNGPVCSNVHSISVQGVEQQFGRCYDGSVLITEVECNAFTYGDFGFKYDSNGKCPSGEKKQCTSSIPFPLAILHEYGEVFECK